MKLSYWMIQAAALFLLLVIERVVGLPVFFLGAFLHSLDITPLSNRKWILLAVVFSLSIVYQTSFVVCSFIVGSGMLLWEFLAKVSSSKTGRVLVSVAYMVMMLIFYLNIVMTAKLLFYTGISTLLLVRIMRNNRVLKNR